MADKRISQLIERTDIANNDVLPIVASGATTTNKVTISTIQDWMQENLDVGVTSVGLSVPSAFSVSGSPVTTSGNITISGAGTTAQYVRGDGSLADFPSISGGGSSVSYYLNGSVSQGTIGGVAYLEMNKTPVLGSGTDFTISSNGYIASFITDAGDPSLLQIPGGNWNFETYFSASSSGGTPSFYVELYKVDSGGTATLIASNSTTPESISLGTTIHSYFSALAVPTTTLALTDRLALRYYVTASGKTITLHTENSHLGQIITTFTTGLTALNGLTAQVQNFATGTSGSDFNISSSSTTHTFNLPDASASNRGVVTTGTQTFAGYKIFNGTIGVNNDLQLATVGTALNTFIKNINATGQTSIGSNGFGFNNANNIYFSGSSKGGGIFAFSNTGNQTYTLQDASGTLAFTSDITTALGSYVPYTGATANLDLGQFDLFADTIRVNGSSPTSGSYLGFKHSTNVTTGAEGYTSIYTFGTNTIGFKSVSGSTNKDFSFDMSSITANVSGGRVYTMPDASGTIALTSNLSSYLPLTGGTLTGALNGTSAVFSGNVTLTGNDSRLAGGDSTGRLVVGNSTTSTYAIFYGATHPTAANTITMVAGNNLALTLASTGAATFSSSVTAEGTFTGKLNALYQNGSTNILNVGSDQAMYGGTNSDGGVFVYGNNKLHLSTNSARRLTIDGSGNVGIGTASPSARLHIKGSGTYEGVIIDNSSTTGGGYFSVYQNGSQKAVFGTSGVILGDTSSDATIFAETGGNIRFYTNASTTERMRISSDGSVGFNGSSSEANAGLDKLSIGYLNGNYGWIQSWNGTPIYINRLANAVYAGTQRIDNNSDERIKENIESIPNALTTILSLQGRKFNMLDENGKLRYGFVAQEVQEHLSDFVTESDRSFKKDDIEIENLLTLESSGAAWAALLVEAIKELKTEIDSLKNQIK